MATVYFIAYIGGVFLVIAYLLRQIGRMANAQEESARHLYEIARDIKAIAISAVEKENKAKSGG